MLRSVRNKLHIICTVVNPIETTSQMIEEGKDKLEWYRQVDPTKLSTLKDLINAPNYKDNLGTLIKTIYEFAFLTYSGTSAPARSSFLLYWFAFLRYQIFTCLQRGALGLTMRFCLFLFRSSLCNSFFAWLHSSCGMAHQPVELSGKLVTKPCVRPSAPLCTFQAPL